MKLATFNDGTRDGCLVLVNKSLTKMHIVENIPTLQYALDHWKKSENLLTELSNELNAGNLANVIDYDATKLLSPLPRAFQWADGSAYVNHVELVRKARNAEMPESFWTDPLMYQGGSDKFLAPTEDIIMSSADFGIDFEAEVAVIVDDVEMGISAENALTKIRLLLLVNDVSLRNLIPNELAKGFGFFQSKPSSAFSPVALTPDELGDSFVNGKLHLAMMVYLNNELFGQPNAGVDMTFHFGQLIAHAAKTRDLAAGTIIGSGTISNYDRSLGSACIAEKRCLETIEFGKPQTAFMQDGDSVKIFMLNDKGENLFGDISQTIRIES